MDIKAFTTVFAAFVLTASAFGETWKDSKGVTWKYEIDTVEYEPVAKIIGATPTPKGTLAIPAAVSESGEIRKVIEIKPYAFCENGSITNVVIPAGVTSVGYNAFGSCGKLKSVTFKGAMSCKLDDVFYDTPFLDVVASHEDNGDSSHPRAISSVSGSARDDNFLAEDTTATGAKAVKWFEWTAPKSGTVWFWTQGNFNTFLGAYAFGTTEDLAHNDNFAGGASLIAFPVAMGAKYTIYVGGADPNYRGEYTLKWRMGSPVTVTFDPCGGSMDVGFGGNVAPYPKNVAAGTLPTPTKEYYTFAGWYTKKSGGIKVPASTKFAKDTKLYAHWAKKKFKVSIKKEEGGASVKGAGTYAWGTKVKLYATPKSGYVFRSWGVEPGWTYYDASCSAFPKYNTQRRKNLTPTVTVPKDSQITYYASFVKKSEDKISMQITSGLTTLYAEDGAGGAVELTVNSKSYPKVTTSKLPAGVKFSLLPPPTNPYEGVVYDSDYKLEIVNPDKIPAGKNVIKITAKNRSGKTATKSITIWGKNKTQASQNGALYIGSGTSVKAPIEIYGGTKYTLANLGVSEAIGWKITSVTGLPSGITWDAKARKLKGFTTKTGKYTLVIKVAKGKTVYTETLTVHASGLPAKVVGKFTGYAAPDEFNGFFNGASLKVTVSVTSAGKVSAKVGSYSFSCNGLAYDHYNNKFRASMSSSVAKSKTVTYTRSLVVELDPAVDCSGNSMDGAYHEYTTKKTAHSISENLLVQCDVVGRKNVFGYDDYGNLLFEGADLAQDALYVATSSHEVSVIPIPEGDGSVTVTLNSTRNGTATLAGTYNGQSFSESAVVWFEPGKGNKAYLTIKSFKLGMTITYVVTLDVTGSYTESVSAPALPFG